MTDRRREVTARQRECHDLAAAGKNWTEIGLALGISAQAARKNVIAAERKGLAALGKTEAKKLGYGAGMFAAMKEGAPPEFDLKVFTETATYAGIPPRLALALGKRIEANYGVVRKELRKLTLAERVEATYDKAGMVLEHIDELSAGTAGVKDLAIAYGILVDKAQLLGGKPTQIYDFRMKQRLEVLMPEFLAEARRRGITVEGEFSRVPEKLVVESTELVKQVE